MTAETSNLLPYYNDKQGNEVQGRKVAMPPNKNPSDLPRNQDMCIWKVKLKN